MRLTKHSRQPVAVQAERSAQAVAHAVASQLVVEVGADDTAVGRAPLHHPVDAWEVDRPHHAAVAQGVGVAVGVIAVGRVAIGQRVVAHEGDGRGVAAERGTAERQPSGGRFEGVLDAVAPGALVAGMVDLVQDHEGIGGQAAQHLSGAGGGHVLVGGDQPVHIAGQATQRGPVGVQLQAQAVGGLRPLSLQVAGGRDHDQPTTFLPQRPPGAGQREGGLAGARGGHGEVIGLVSGSEAIERGSLPRPQAHAGTRGETGIGGNGGRRHVSRPVWRGTSTQTRSVTRIRDAQGTEGRVPQITAAVTD